MARIESIKDAMLAISPMRSIIEMRSIFVSIVRLAYITPYVPLEMIISHFDFLGRNDSFHFNHHYLGKAPTNGFA